MQFINIASEDVHNYLSAKGFRALNKERLNNSYVYVYPNNESIRKILNSKFSEQDYFFDKKLKF